MARLITALTDTQIRNAKAKEKDYSLSDGNGLYLLIKSNGSKIWRFNYYRPQTKKRALISFGNYPEVSLQLARKRREESRELVEQGIDPQEFRASELRQVNENYQNTFKNVALKWFEVEQTKGFTKSTLTKKWASLENHVFPQIGDLPITKITPYLVINALEPLKNAGSLSTVKRICQRINEIMTHATILGLLQTNPLMMLTSAFESPKVENRPAIKPSELPEFMRALSLARIELQTRCLIEWQLLTITHPNEAASAMWSEIDIEQSIWVIPAERMKMRREHVIPLSKQALSILERMKPISAHRMHVFPTFVAPYDKPMNASSANVAIKRMGYQGRLVAHGLRSVASTALNEAGFSPDVIEAALAHVDKNAVRRTYNRATYLEPRKKMMQFWGDFVESASLGSVSLSSVCEKAAD